MQSPSGLGGGEIETAEEKRHSELLHGHRWSHAPGQIIATKSTKHEPKQKGKTQISQPDLRLIIQRQKAKSEWGKSPIRPLAGQGRQGGQRQEPFQRKADNTGNTRARTRTARRKTKKDSEPAGAQRQHDHTSPTGQHKQRSTGQTKRRRTAETQ